METPGVIADDDNHFDDALVRYMERSQPLHALLRQVLTQVAGCSLALTLDHHRGLGLNAAIHMAREGLARADEDLRAVTVPAEAAHHYHHMQQAAEAIAAALALLAARRGTETEWLLGRLATGLRSTTEHLRVASRLMPGHPMVDLASACCALHARELIDPLQPGHGRN